MTRTSRSHIGLRRLYLRAHGASGSVFPGRKALIANSLMGLCFWGGTSVFVYGFVEMQRVGVESVVKGNLGALRGALSVYYGDEKSYPRDLSALTREGKYTSRILEVRSPGYHSASDAVRYGKTPDDAGGWLYDNVVGDPNFGSIWINCTHTDHKGSAWNSY